MNNFREFNNGKAPAVRSSRYDSEAEKIISVILHRIWKDYGLYENMDILLSSQQPLDNYIEIPKARYSEVFENKYRNKHKWMKFDFIFESVYEYKEKLNYVPVAVIECDGEMYHDNIEQQKLDSYKDGIAENIGAPMLRVKYRELDVNGTAWSRLPSFEAKEARFRELYEDELINNIIRGRLTKTVNRRAAEDFSKMQSAQKMVDVILKRYARWSRYSEKNMKYYGEIGKRMQFILELERQKSNIYSKL